MPKDLNEVSPWAQEAVLKLWSSGLFQGDEKGNFNPKNNATRAEAAAFSVRINEKVEQWYIDTGEVEDPIQDLSGGHGSSATYYRFKSS